MKYLSEANGNDWNSTSAKERSAYLREIVAVANGGSGLRVQIDADKLLERLDSHYATKDSAILSQSVLEAASQIVANDKLRKKKRL